MRERTVKRHEPNHQRRIRIALFAALLPFAMRRHADTPAMALTPRKSCRAKPRKALSAAPGSSNIVLMEQLLRQITRSMPGAGAAPPTSDASTTGRYCPRAFSQNENPLGLNASPETGMHSRRT
ncbi:hypothetical protein OHD62_01265 [Mesorhizobium sp. YC-39]|uniref:hypothetical protein n=1 Tax=unclassified Mesorhizobium TaxID=325217 RepID=UPI0021E8AF1C|nr:MULTISPECIES: hypothetical protein [unclassified Mesorhizobium]MCV3206615.1 hypothetical protein [Mesorhizobium sp. YC-2]MCV3226985.1 hypothetical protein [Mesorhizobium sp. YC-39]